VEILHQRCAGLDVHKDTVVACARLVTGRDVSQAVETFSTTTQGLLALSEWLAGQGCTHVAMEATGVYWKPVWHILEGSFTLVLANAAHIRNVPGRKTDVNDAMWIADLLAHGLIRGSFVPPTAIQELRTLTRTRKQLVRERAQHVQRIQKTLEDANLKLASVVSNVLGASGRAILNALVAGETRPEQLVELTNPRLKASRSTLLAALEGRVTAHHRFLLKLHLDQIDALERAIAAVEAEIGVLLEPFRARSELLTTIPGVSETVAQAIVSEIGIDMGRFPTAGHLISWAGLCPAQHESAGKRRPTRLRHGGAWLKTILVQAAWGAARTRDTYLRAQFLRLKSRRGPKKAILAVAASILTAAYHMLRDGTTYRDLGGDYFARHDRSQTIRRLVRKLHDLGCTVELAADGGDAQVNLLALPPAVAGSGRFH
jgi:transposase